jgi:hypothetical protein
VTHPAIAGRITDVKRCGSKVWLSQPEMARDEFGIRAVSPSGSILETRLSDVRPRFLRCAGSRLWILSAQGHLGFLDVA